VRGGCSRTRTYNRNMWVSHQKSALC
jgi:hypothetical protein